MSITIESGQYVAATVKGQRLIFRVPQGFNKWAPEADFKAVNEQTERVCLGRADLAFLTTFIALAVDKGYVLL